MAKCDKCGVERKVNEGSVGKKHKNCGGRKRGESKKNCGTWR